MPSKRERERQRKVVERAAHRMQAEGDGVWEMAVVGARDVPDMFTSALAGDAKLGMMAWAVMQALKSVAALKPGSGQMRCLLCADSEFSIAPAPALFILAFAAVDKPRMIMCNGVCDDCAGKHRHQMTLRAAVMAAYSKGWGGNFRVLPDEAPGGHA